MVNENKDNLEFDFQGIGLKTSEKRWAHKRFKEYQENYHLDNFSDAQLLEELVYREAIQERYKKKIKSLQDSKTVKEQNIVPKFVLKALNDNLTQILLLKEKLGLFEKKKEVDDVFKHIQTLKKKYQKWLEENQGSRTRICPHCGKMIMFKIRTDKWDAVKHPFFKDRILTNEHLLKLYKDGKLTKEDVAKVLSVSPDYVDFILDKIKPTD
jgi:hypothetical protein